MSMRMYMHEITLPEKEILGRQYDNSPFGKNPRTGVTTLDIFDFDSTLFLSPMLTSNIWHHSFINTITTENLIGPGWWRDIRSLPREDWETYWNEDVVEQVKKSSKDPSHLTVLLTGRRYYPFHHLVESILKSKGLEFDIIGLRPDPEKLDEPTNELGFNNEPNIFETTMEFKTSFIVNMLSTIPTLKEIIMWDDRVSHITVFQAYLKKLESVKLINHGELVCIKATRPKYNPTWEKKIVQDMIDSHNNAILKLKSKGETLDNIKTIESYNGEMVSSNDLFQLKSVPSIQSLGLSESISQQLKLIFQPIHTRELKTIKLKDWEHTCAEECMYFGNQILLSSTTVDEDKEYEFKIINRTKADIEFGMILQVELIQNGEYAILPLWYKPSMFSTLLKKNDYKWIPVENNNPEIYLAKSTHHHLLTVTKL